MAVSIGGEQPHVPRADAADDLRRVGADNELASRKQTHKRRQDFALPRRMQMELDLVDADETRRFGERAPRKLQKQPSCQVNRKQKVRLFTPGQRLERNVESAFLPQEQHSIHAAVRFSGPQYRRTSGDTPQNFLNSPYFRVPIFQVVAINSFSCLVAFLFEIPIPEVRKRAGSRIERLFAVCFGRPARIIFQATDAILIEVYD